MVYLQEPNVTESPISPIEINAKNVCLIGMGDPLAVLQSPALTNAQKLVIYTTNFGKIESDFFRVLRKLNPDVEIHLVLKSQFKIDMKGLNFDYITDDKNYLQDIFNNSDNWNIINNSSDPFPSVKKQDKIQVQFKKKTLAVYQLLLEGYRYDDIAEKLSISLDSVRFCIKKIYLSSGVNSKSELMAKYHQGLIELV